MIGLLRRWWPKRRYVVQEGYEPGRGWYTDTLIGDRWVREWH